MVMVVEKVPAAWLVEIVTSLSQAVEGVTAVPLSSSPQRIFTVGFCPPVLLSTAGKHGRLPRRLVDTHRPETGRDDGLGNGGGGANQRAKGEKEGFMDAYRSHDIILSVALRAGQRVAWVKRKNSQP